MAVTDVESPQSLKVGALSCQFIYEIFIAASSAELANGGDTLKYRTVKYNALT